MYTTTVFGQFFTLFNKMLSLFCGDKEQVSYKKAAFSHHFCYNYYTSFFINNKFTAVDFVLSYVILNSLLKLITKLFVKQKESK